MVVDVPHRWITDQLTQTHAARLTKIAALTVCLQACGASDQKQESGPTPVATYDFDRDEQGADLEGWGRSNGHVHSGEWAAKASGLAQGQAVSIFYSCHGQAHDSIEFQYSSPGESGYRLSLYIDGNTEAHASYAATAPAGAPEIPYVPVRVDVPLGIHDYRWEASYDILEFADGDLWLDTIRCYAIDAEP